MALSANARSVLQIAGAALSIVFTVGALAIFLVPDLDMDSVVANSGVAAPILFVLLKASTIVLPASGIALYPLAPRLFGTWLGIGLCVAGDLLGYLVLYGLARTIGFVLLRKLLPERTTSKVVNLIAAVGNWRGFLTARLLFFIAPEIPSAAAGIAGLAFGPYIAVSAPLIVVTAVTLALPGVIIVSDTALAVAMTGVGLVFVGMHIARRWRAGRRSGRGDTQEVEAKGRDRAP